MFKKKNAEASERRKSCEFCENATVISDEDNILCGKYGIVKKEFCCKKYTYDPLKRVPKPLPPMPKLSEEDFII